MKLQIRLMAAAIALTLAAPVLAGPKAELPKELPAYAPDAAIPKIDIAKRTLSNGLEVWVLPRNGIPRVDVALALRDAGYAADPKGSNGFASILAGMLSEGTTVRDSRAIAELSQGLGGGVYAGAGNDGLTVGGYSLASNAPQMMDLLAEVVRSPAFPENELTLAKANALQALKVNEAQPNTRAARAMLAATFGDHPYARIMPTEQSIQSVTRAQLLSEYQRRFRPERGLLVLTGKLTAEQGFAMAEKAFGSWKGVGTATAATPKAPMTAPVTRAILQRDGSVQSAILIGRPAIAATHPDYFPLGLASDVLGGGFSSRVNQNLREDKGYTYGASATDAEFAAGGRVQAGANVRNEVTGAALKEFFGEFDRLAKEPVPAAELNDTKRYVAGGFLITNQMQSSVARTLANNWLVGLPIEAFTQYVDKVRAVSAAQVQAMARKYWKPADMSVIVVGDSKAVSDQLKPFGEFEQRK